MTHFSALQVHALHDAALTPADADPHASPDDPASVILTDLRVAPSVSVPGTEPLRDALRLMQLAGVRMAFVVDRPNAVTGLVTAADLQGERPTRIAVERGLAHGDLSVADVMTPITHWPAIDIDGLRRARVGDVVQTFRSTGCRYLLVTEPGPADGAPLLRGIFSANRAERALGQRIDDELRSRNLVELANALAHA